MTLSIWEQFIVSAAISFLTIIKSEVKNATELAALDAALEFLTDLLSGKIANS